ncbi:hypothetical protein BC826DRAFT_1130973 [Russula brevipes]|nr:hypothetical protein BC826DRAFT_1130973 [Russula brevipes]
MHGGRVNPVRGMTGILCPSLEARIIREDGSDADYEEIGELILRGPTIALGFWNNEEATNETFKDGCCTRGIASTWMCRNDSSMWIVQRYGATSCICDDFYKPLPVITFRISSKSQGNKFHPLKLRTLFGSTHHD